MTMQKTTFLKMTDVSRELLGELLEAAARFKADRTHPAGQDLSGQTWALLFHKSSTRTRVSFEVGIHELGGHAMILDQNRMQTGRGESVEDTAKVLSRYIHGIIIRTYEHAWLESFAEAAEMPVINALTDSFHPCQALADLFSLAERWGKPGELLSSLRGRKLVFYGDCSCNMAHSLALAGALAEMEVVLCGPEDYGPGDCLEGALREAGLPAGTRFEQDPLAAAEEADVLYTDVWVSMGTDEEAEARRQAMKPYQVNGSVLSGARREALFMHCLPAHVGEEVSEDVYRSAASIVYDQAENRLHAQKAVLSMLGKS